MKILKNKSTLLKNKGFSSEIKSFFFFHNKNNNLMSLDEKYNLSDKSRSYWDNCDLNIDSMSGLSYVNEQDIIHSNKILNRNNIDNINSLLEIGTGLGRVFNNVLLKRLNINSVESISNNNLKYSHNIDCNDNNEKNDIQSKYNTNLTELMNSKLIHLVEPQMRFTNQLKIKLEKYKIDDKVKIINKKVEDINKYDFINFDVNDFQTYKFDLIYIQWVLEYISDDNILIQKLKLFKELLQIYDNENGIKNIDKSNCNNKLKDNQIYLNNSKSYDNGKCDLNSDKELKKSYIIIKENVDDQGSVILSQGSYIRTADNFRNIFEKSGLKIVDEDVLKINNDIFDIHMWILI